MSWWLLPVTVILSFLVTGVLRRYALAKNLMDVPNLRSSHTTPTPRGGGVAIVVSFLTGLSYLFFVGVISNEIYLGLFAPCALVAILGFLDDHGHIPARWRLLGHFFASGLALFFLGGLPPLVIFGWTLDLGTVGDILAVIFLVWMLNLYNFMDGIDGLASVQAVTSCCSAAFIYWLVGPSDDSFLPLLLACAVIGFLAWNFPPARIFMGDAGSGFLGILLGVFTLQAAMITTNFLWSWLILLGVFIVDATVTLIRRLLRGDRVYEAHRSHAYQFASRHYGKHLPVTLAVLVINVLWLLPISALVGTGRLDGTLGLLIAYAPLVLLAFRYHAGCKEAEIAR